MRAFILIVIAISLFNCGEDPNPANETVHLAGTLVNSNMDGDNTASYWKDGVYTDLTGNNIQSRVSSLYVNGSSVLIGGIKYTAIMPTSIVWKDGIENVIDEAFGNPLIVADKNNLYGVWLTWTSGYVINKNGTSQPIIDTADYFAPMAMTVHQEDVYPCGFASLPLTPPDYSSPQFAQYWKNGQLMFRESEASYASSITVHDNNVYMAGAIYNSMTTSIACYWKNGQRVDLTDGNSSAIVSSIYVTDKAVFVAGVNNNQAVYWKNGEMIQLTNGTIPSGANSIFVKGNDVYVAGAEQGFPAYWKNESRQSIENDDKPGQIRFIVVGSN